MTLRSVPENGLRFTFDINCGGSLTYFVPLGFIGNRFEMIRMVTFALLAWR